ncbi:class IIb bacteriocin, lactobin A/cerein 7B family [Neisseria canis]|uniref:Class IIb bacteriocin, lactobin A/cerein 7B family n=1 Tax=Neisseria canis TaxID=493 RepID=A0A3S5E8B5_9NEIS|nr:class IIb bacteriocin, lactobin A/cerein 7B family [Neisseria canis]VEF01860.1 class IIb bacteriocin, lactobin A/cerein 7B family [Neisseria canis]
MQELKMNELEQVSGGVGPLAAVVIGASLAFAGAAFLQGLGHGREDARS